MSGTNHKIKPIDAANSEIRNLKKIISQLRKDLISLTEEIKPLKEDLEKRNLEAQRSEEEYVKETKGWWWD